MKRQLRRAAPRRHHRARVALGIGAGLGVAALINLVRARAAEAANPPLGRFVEADGVRVHYVEHGDRGAPPVVLIHGNFSMVQDFALSPVVAALAQRHRIIVFDRPGFGYSERPRGAPFTSGSQ